MLLRRTWTMAIALAALAAACDGVKPPRVPQAGDPAPVYAAVTIDGKPVSLADFRGQAVLLNVWATWCHPCREELPDLQRLHQANAARGLRIVGVSVDEAGQEAEVREFAREHGVTYDLWLDPSEKVSSTFATVGVPTTVLIGPDGMLLWRHVGPVKADDPELVRLIEQALAGRRAAPGDRAAAPVPDSAEWCRTDGRGRTAGTLASASAAADTVCEPGTEGDPVLGEWEIAPRGETARAAVSALRPSDL